jgi:hypothetical protein
VKFEDSVSNKELLAKYQALMAENIDLKEEASRLQLGDKRGL